MLTLLKNGYIVDGDRTTLYKADLLIEDDKISKIVPKYEGNADKIIDCTDKIVAPGFIDIHAHSDVAPFSNKYNDSKIYQGVTFEVCGNCGVSCVPVSKKNKDKQSVSLWEQFEDKPSIYGDGYYNDLLDYKNDVDKIGYLSNVGMLVGHGTIRNEVMGFDNRKPTEIELQKMCDILDEQLSKGAFGMSLGLIYPPGSFSEKEEIIELAKIVKKHNGILTVHMRSEGNYIFEAVQEMIDVARISKVKLEISHLKILTRKHWGESDKLIQLIYEAQREGIDVTCDQYPYTATNTVVAALLPKQTMAGGKLKTLARLLVPSKKMLTGIHSLIEERGGGSAILISQTCGKLPEYEGKTLQEISNLTNQSQEELVVKIVRKTLGSARAIYFSINEDDMLNIMKEMFVSVGSDGAAYCLEDKLSTNPHPRNIATFNRFLQIVRDKKFMSIEDAVYKMTGLPSDVLGLNNRGRLKPGNIADITVFDLNEIKDNCEYTNSFIKPNGIEHVIVNGVLTLENHNLLKTKPGKVILKNN